MNSDTQTERRRSRRYIVTGDLQIETGNRVYNGNIVNLSESGFSVRSNDSIEPGSNIHAVLRLQKYPETIILDGQICGIQDNLVSIKLFSPDLKMKILVQWLEIENYPWTANLKSTAKPIGNSLGSSSEELDQAERENLRDHLHSLG